MIAPVSESHRSKILLLKEGWDDIMSHSFFLFARPSFYGGMARLLDFGGTLNVYNSYPTGEMADAKALSEDWKAVAADLRSAVAQYRAEQSSI